ncbi:MAG: hypothetical protein KF802_00870 [Bdellovibrionaceae bacterium]|nr:hypothetical protein [Pseudobdellovibrionaceae bacterium]
MKRASGCLLALLVLMTWSLSWAQLRPSVEELVDYETKGNAVSNRSNEAVTIRNYEIPLRLLVKDLAADRIPRQALNALIFQKNGEDYVRWIINPEDTKWHLELEAWMRENGVSTRKHGYFEGYMTASRSYIVRDPKSKMSFSLKVSTDNTGGNWRDKRQTWDDARQVKLASDHAMKAIQMRTPENFIFMDEPLVFGVEKIDQGMLLRLLADLPTTERVYVPGFSALHEAEGLHIARLNGSNDPAEFWKEHYVKPLAKAIAELSAMTGLAYDSPHSQNFLVELDKNFKPTGKIVFRDLGDSYLTVEMAQAMKRTELLKYWEKDNKIKSKMFIAQGILHGNSKPSWVSEAVYNEYGRVFFLEFEKEFSRVTGVPVQELFADGTYGRNGDYFSKQYFLINKPGWQGFLKRLEKDGGLKPVAMACGRVMML